MDWFRFQYKTNLQTNRKRSCLSTNGKLYGSRAIKCDNNKSNNRSRKHSSNAVNLSKIALLILLSPTSVLANAVSQSNNGYEVTYGNTSDYRLKENIVDLPDAITRLKTLKPRRYNWIDDPNNTLTDGFIAHELMTTVPQAVTGTKDQVDSNNDPVYQQMDQSKLVPLLVAALQEAVARIEALEGS